MMRFYTYFWLTFCCQSCIFISVISAQETGGCNYRQYIDDAQAALKDKNKKNYVLAVQKYLTASYCDPVKAKSDKIDVKISNLFDEIERLRKKSVEDAAAAKKFTEEIKKKQDAAKIALRTTYYTEAKLQINKTKPGYRLAYLLAKKALEYDAQYLPARNLADSIFLYCPIDLREEDRDLLSGENINFWYSFSEINQDSIQYVNMVDNSNWAYVITRNNNTYLMYWIDTTLQKIEWETSMSFKYGGWWGFYDTEHDWIIVNGLPDKDGLNPYSIYSLKEKKVIRTGPPIEEIYIDSLSSTLIEYHKNGARVYSLPDFKLTDTCAFFNSALLKDSLSVFIKAYELTDVNQKRNANELALDETPEFYKYIVEIRDRNGVRATKTVDNKKLINYRNSDYYFSEDFGNLIFADSTGMLILGMPDLDTIFYQNPCDFSSSAPTLKEWMGGFLLVDRSDDSNHRIKIVDKKNSSNILLERENYIAITPLFDKSRSVFMVETTASNDAENKSLSKNAEIENEDISENPNTIKEIFTFERGYLRTLGRWSNMIWLQEKKTIVTWTDEKTEIFRLDSSASGYFLFPMLHLRGASIIKNSRDYYSRYLVHPSDFVPKEVDSERGIYAFFTQLSEKEILMTLVDSLFTRLGEHVLKSEIDIRSIKVEDSFMLSESHTNESGHIISATMLSDKSQSFISYNTPTYFADYWISESRDWRKKEEFLLITQVKKGVIKQDSVLYSGKWQVFEHNKKIYIAFDSDKKLIVSELGQIKHPLQSWGNISEWEIESDMIFMKQGKSERSVFDLILFDIKNQTTHTYIQKLDYKICAFKKSGDANLSNYLVMGGKKNDSTWIEIVSFPEIKTVIPNCPFYTRGDYWNGERVNLITRSDSTLDYVLIKEQKVSGLIYYVYKFPEMVLLDSVENIVAEAWHHQVYSKYKYERNIGCIVKNAAGAVYHFDFNQYQKRLLHKKSITKEIEHNNAIYYIEEADSLFFYDGRFASFPLLAAFKIPDGANYDFSYKNFVHIPKGFVFSTQKNNYFTLWHYSNQNRKVQLLVDSVLMWGEYEGSISIYLGNQVNNQFETSITFVSDSTGKLMQVGRIELTPSKSEVAFYENYEDDYFWGFTEDTVRQTYLCRFYKRVKDDIHGFYFQLIDSIPNEKSSYLEKQKDEQMKFIIDDPRGNLCLCKVDPKPTLQCVWHNLPINGIPKGVLQISDDILLSFDNYDRKIVKNGKVSVFSLSKSKKLREISLPHDRAERWEVSENGYWLHVSLGSSWDDDTGASEAAYFLGNSIEFDAFMLQKQNFTREEAELFGID